ncbi:MAG: gfo/Idh/MocA family oxidoreductase, partial [Armatimonadota bacterium]|nr:gfo/Idh/MocA family oxidoreductase [Armatimonadota bacterium]
EGKARYHPEQWYEVPEWCEVTFEYANGTRVIGGQKIRGGVTFEGEKGTVYVTRGKIEATPPEVLQQPLSEKDVRLYESRSHHGNWLDCIKSRKLPICDVAIGHRSATVCHLGNIAIRSGRRVQWDAAREAVVGDPEQAAMLSRPYRAPWKLPA